MNEKAAYRDGESRINNYFKKNYKGKVGSESIAVRINEHLNSLERKRDSETDKEQKAFFSGQYDRLKRLAESEGYKTGISDEELKDIRNQQLELSKKLLGLK